LKIRLLKDAKLQGSDFAAGTTLLVDDNTAQGLLNEGKAVVIPEKKEGDEGFDPEGKKSDGKEKTGDEFITEDDKKMAAMAQAVAKSIVDEFKQTQEEIIKRLPKVEVIEREDPTGGFKSFGHFIHDVRKSKAEKSKTLTKYLQGISQKNAVIRNTKDNLFKDVMMEGEDSAGGFLVPTQYRAALLQQALEVAFFYPRCQFIPMATNKIEIPAMFDTNHSGDPIDFYGGVNIIRVAEKEQKTKSRPKFGNVELNLHEVAGLVYVTNALLEDSPISVEAVLNSVFSQAIAFLVDDDCIEGDGAGKPEGFLNSPALITITRTGAGIAAADVTNLWQSLHPACKMNAIWIANHENFTPLTQTTIGDSPMWMPANGLSGKPYDMLMGRPCFFTEKAPAKDLKGDLSVVDPTQYLLGGKAGFNVKTDMSMHLRFDYDETAYRFVLRYDGKGWWKAPLTPKNASEGFQLSPFVTLDEAPPQE